LLFLDRDGTLNRAVGHRPPNTPEEVSLYPDVGAVLASYVAQGWQLVMVTNQGGIASGYITEEQAQAIQQRVIELLPVPLAAAYLCPHLPGASVARYDLDCPNRKPRPGFVLQALRRFGAQPEDCLFIGDSSTDRDAAHAAQVPFEWADRFFDRPIDRGIRTAGGDWYGVQQVSAENEPFQLVAMARDQQIGSLTLSVAETAAGAGEASLDLTVRTLQGRAEAALALVETALQWARARGS
jgi:D-glycero-D-manno-heptose 1,7-bisphosphate phosphatase